MRPNVTRNAAARRAGGSIRSRLAAAAAATLTAVGFGACSDSPTAVSSAPPPSASAAAPSADLTIQSTQVLYDQASTATGTISIELPDIIDASMLFANDFGVPQGQRWSVTRVVIPGVAPAPNPTATHRIAIHADKAGQPGILIYEGVLAPTGAEAGAPVPGLTSYTYSLPAPVVLGAGTYWLVSECDVDVFVCAGGPVVGSPTHLSFVGWTEWQSFAVDGLGDYDLAFALHGESGDPADAADAAADLQSILTGFVLPAGTSTSLAAKLREALDAIAAGDTAAACRALSDFINQTRALSGKKLTTAQADALITEANRIRGLLGC